MRFNGVRFSGLLAILLLIVPTAGAIAQKDGGDGPVGIFQSRAEYREFIGGVKEVAYGENGNAQMRAMVPLLNDIALNKSVGWSANQYGVSRSTIGLLADSNVRSELEMVDDQYKELQQMNEQIQNRVAKQLRVLDISDFDSLADNIRDIRQRAEHDLNSVLLPHQLERLLQIRMQAQLRHRRLVDVLTSSPLKKQLKISAKQSQKLKKVDKKIQDELEKEIAKLRQKARQRLLSSLKPKQKKRVEKLLGTAFKFKKPVKRKKRFDPSTQKKS